MKVGFYDVLVWSLDTNEVREVAAEGRIYGEEGGNFVTLEGGVQNQPKLLFPH